MWVAVEGGRKGQCGWRHQDVWWVIHTGVEVTENLERRKSKKEDRKPELKSSGNKSDQERRSEENSVTMLQAYKIVENLKEEGREMVTELKQDPQKVPMPPPGSA